MAGLSNGKLDGKHVYDHEATCTDNNADRHSSLEIRSRLPVLRPQAPTHLLRHPVVHGSQHGVQRS